MLCSEFTQVLKATVGATEHISMHCITFEVPVKCREKKPNGREFCPGVVTANAPFEHLVKPPFEPGGLNI